jgi:alkaline phosphatase
MSAVWNIEEAQVQLPQLIDHALTIGPQSIARDGDTLVVVVASHEWDGMVQRESDAAAFSQKLQGINQTQTGGLKNYICG